MTMMNLILMIVVQSGANHRVIVEKRKIRQGGVRGGRNAVTLLTWNPIVMIESVENHHPEDGRIVEDAKKKIMTQVVVRMILQLLENGKAILFWKRINGVISLNCRN